MSNQPIIAVFIDADNIQSHNVKKIMDVLTPKGNVMIRRVYANWTKSDEYLTGWASAIAEHGYKAIQQFDHVQGKNASDMAMIVDVMEFLYTKSIDIFCLVSSDSDFTPLCLNLREMGKTVIGMGNRNTSKSLINVCHDFHYLNFNQKFAEKSPDKPADEPKKAPEVPKPPSSNLSLNLSLNSGAVSASNVASSSASTAPKRSGNPNHNKELIALVHQWVAKEGKDGWLIASTLGQLLQKHGYFYQHFGFDKLAMFMKALKDFDVKFEGSNYYIGEKTTHNLSMQLVEEYASTDELVSVNDVQAMTVDNALINAIGSAVAVHQVDGWADTYAVTAYLEGTFGIRASDYGYVNLLELLKNITTFELNKVEKRYFVKDLRAHAETVEIDQKSDGEKRKHTTEELQENIELMRVIAGAIDDNLVGSWATAMDVGQQLKGLGISAKDYGYKNIGLLLKASELFELVTKDGQTYIKSPTGKVAPPKKSPDEVDLVSLAQQESMPEMEEQVIEVIEVSETDDNVGENLVQLEQIIEHADDVEEAFATSDEISDETAGSDESGNDDCDENADDSDDVENVEHIKNVENADENTADDGFNANSDVDSDDEEEEEVEEIDGHEFLAVLNNAIDCHHNQDGWAKVSDVGADIKKAFGVGSTALGYRTFADFFATLDGYELQKSGRIWQIRQKEAWQNRCYPW